MKQKILPSLPQDNVRMIILGSSESGKTTLLMSILLSKNGYYRHFKQIFVVCPTIFDKSPKNTFNKIKWLSANIRTEYDESFIDDCMRRSSLLYDKTGQRSLLILDDVTDAEGLRKGGGHKSILGSVFYRGSHSHLSCIVLLHELKAVDPLVRKQINSIICFYYGDNQEQKNLYELSGVPITFQQFKQIYLISTGYNQDDTHKYDFININTKSKSPKTTIYHNWKAIDLTEFVYNDKLKQPNTLIDKQEVQPEEKDKDKTFD